MHAQIRLNAAAFISPQNHPILIRNFTSSKQDDLKYHYVAHCSLDVIEERLSANTKNYECYLGLLYSMEDLAVYGYVTPMKLRIVIAIALVDTVVRDSDVVLIFKALYSAYRRALSNPFLKLFGSPDAQADPTSLLIAGSPNRWKAFKQRVDDVGKSVCSNAEETRT